MKILEDFIEENLNSAFDKALIRTNFVNSKNITGNKIIKKDGFIFCKENIIAFCEKYNLDFNDSCYFKGEIPSGIINKISSYVPHETVYEYNNYYSCDWGGSGETIFYSKEKLNKIKKGFFSGKYYRQGKEKAREITDLKSTYHIIYPKNNDVGNYIIFERYFDIELNCYMYQIVTYWEIFKK